MGTGTTALSSRYVRRIPRTTANKPFFRYSLRASTGRSSVANLRVRPDARPLGCVYACSGDSTTETGSWRTHASVWVSQNR